MSIMLLDIYGVTKKMWETLGFLLQAMIEGSLGVSGNCTLQLSFGT